MIWTLPVFVGLAALIYMALPERRVKRERLGIERERASLSKSVDSALERHGKRAGMVHALNLAGMDVEPGVLVLRVLLFTALATVLGLLISPWLALAGLVAPTLVARQWVTSKARRRQERFAAQLPDVLQLLIAALRSGLSLNQALEAVVTEAEEPMRSEIDYMLAETRVGKSLDVAMRSTAARMVSKDLEWVAGAVAINRETGGNLADVLENVNETLRGRYRLRRQIKTLTAEGRMSVKVLTGIPIAVFVGRAIFDSSFRDVMFHGAGPFLLAYGAVSLLIGWLVVSRIVRLKGV
jgi:tight adherence protein B